MESPSEAPYTAGGGRPARQGSSPNDHQVKGLGADLAFEAETLGQAGDRRLW